MSLEQPQNAQLLAPAKTETLPAESEPAAKENRDPLEISFSLVWGDKAPLDFTLRGTHSRVTIGRSPECNMVIPATSVSYEHCELFVKRKHRDAVLCVRDLSKNHTGVKHARSDDANRPWHELQLKEVEELQHRSQLLVPMRQRNAEEKRTPVTILLKLPDAYCSWRQEGRWLYLERLGEGGLAVVYRARDISGSLGEVAIKVSKFSNLPEVSAQNRHIYAMHREARWSMERLHNFKDDRYDPRWAPLFVRYLEDHTGFSGHGPTAFDEARLYFEDPNFSWGKHKFCPPLARQPYIVMELVHGRLLQAAIEDRPPLDEAEKHSILQNCCESLVYLERFEVIHRDFRGCNIFLMDRGAACRLKVIDLGFMISVQPRQATNPNPAVRCAWQGDPARKLRFDWAPPEVRTKTCRNFAQPPSSFDVFSLGVLILKLLKGRSWTQDALSGGQPELEKAAGDIEEIGLSKGLLLRMLDHGKPAMRPLPSTILSALKPRKEAPAAASEAMTCARPKWVGMPAPPPKRPEAGRERSRSRGREPEGS